jgi:hypothetical protein
MSKFATLDAERDVFCLFLGHGVRCGAELMRLLNITSAGQFMEKMKPLLNAQLIGVSGNANDESDVLYAVFYLIPSAVPFVRVLLGQRGRNADRP